MLITDENGTVQRLKDISEFSSHSLHSAFSDVLKFGKDLGNHLGRNVLPGITACGESQAHPPPYGWLFHCGTVPDVAKFFLELKSAFL